MSELQDLEQAFGKTQQTIVNNHNEFKDTSAKLLIEIMRLDNTVTKLANATKNNVDWLNLVDKAIKELRNEKPKAKSFFDKLIGK